MKPFLASSAALLILGMAALYSATGATRPNDKSAEPDLQIAVEAKNPWTDLQLNNDPKNFQFAIVTDRTGGHRPGVFKGAIDKLNLLQPEFVVSVGDLIEGGTEDPGRWALEWSEFQSNVERLEMPFFYLPGNHDISNMPMFDEWNRKFGRSYYSFRYHDVLFLCLNSEDPPRKGSFHFSQDQQDWAQTVLAQNKDARWTIVLLHKPTWTYVNADLEASGWTPIEDALGDRPYTVFSGHKHNYAKSVRRGRDYYMLATTGGGSNLSGKDQGKFDHVVWVTMKDDGPVISNLLLEGIEHKNIRTIPDPRKGK
jgi:3',5'-cyclic AMP phosphodiesterase CpdA